jgi:hypothetical protein
MKSIPLSATYVPIRTPIELEHPLGSSMQNTDWSKNRSAVSVLQIILKGISGILDKYIRITKFSQKTPSMDPAVDNNIEATTAPDPNFIINKVLIRWQTNPDPKKTKVTKGLISLKTTDVQNRATPTKSSIDDRVNKLRPQINLLNIFQIDTPPKDFSLVSQIKEQIDIKEIEKKRTFLNFQIKFLHNSMDANMSDISKIWYLTNHIQGWNSKDSDQKQQLIFRKNRKS